jgi:CRP-like cAMP-binding protein
MLYSSSHGAKSNTISTGVVVQDNAPHSVSDSLALTTSDLDVLDRGRHLHRTVPAGQDILRQGERNASVYILIEGWALCYRVLDDGQRQILDLVLPGGILGFGFSRSLPYGVEAKTPCKVAVFSRDSFLSALLKTPDLCLKCAELFALAEARAFERLSRVGRLGAKERVAGLIVELARRLTGNGNGNGNGEEWLVKLPLTQHDIADMLGLASETVCRALMSLRRQRLTTWQNGKLEIHDLPGLIAAAGEDAEALDFELSDEECEYEGHHSKRAAFAA